MHVRRSRRVFMILGACLLVLGAAPPAPPSEGCARQMRAVWISTVSNIDWPSRAGLDVAQQQAEYRTVLDNAVRLRLNTVMVQVRPTADALWPSNFEPWSQWLTGTQGRDPGYDPLAFLIRETHARGLEFHAWFNPYRVSTQGDPAVLVAEHPARQHPEWVFGYGGKLYYDPGVPQAREFVMDAMMDAVARYDIDAVVLDDYFYPYPLAGQEIPDAATFAAHRGTFTDIGDWRRDNVDRLVQGMAARIDALASGVEFGISPFGIWRNRADDPRGSDTRGTSSYSAIFADSRNWVEKRWIDYISPQIYWEIGHPVADYAALVPWWASVVEGTGVELHIGQAAYKVGSSPAWGAEELARHLTVNQGYPAVRGDAYFSAASLTSNATAAIERVAEEHYRQPAECSGR